MNQIIDPSKWKISLPLYPPDEVLDNSVIQEYTRCPRRGLYKYGMRRGFDGKSYPIQYGLAYHKYRETVENLMREQKSPMTDEIHQAGWVACIEGWEDPPPEHKKAHLDLTRLVKAVNQARLRIQEEQRSGSVVITRPEEAFDLELPFEICEDCGWAILRKEDLIDTCCPNCGSGHIYSPRHGGRVDQFIQYRSLKNADMVRDFKTTGSKGDYYEQKFDPNAQLQGYVWAGGQLSGRKFDGALIETVYNTKTKGPEITQHYVTFSPGQEVAWLASMMMERSFIQTMWSRVDELGYLAFPQRTSSCQDFGGCHFRDACRTGGGWELNNWLENNTIESHWDFTNPEGEESQV